MFVEQYGITGNDVAVSFRYYANDVTACNIEVDFDKNLRVYHGTASRNTKDQPNRRIGRKKAFAVALDQLCLGIFGKPDSKMNKKERKMWMAGNKEFRERIWMMYKKHMPKDFS